VHVNIKFHLHNDLFLVRKTVSELFVNFFMLNCFIFHFECVSVLTECYVVYLLVCFKIFDTDHNGVLSIEELRTMIYAMLLLQCENSLPLNDDMVVDYNPNFCLNFICLLPN